MLRLNMILSFQYRALTQLRLQTFKTLLANKSRVGTQIRRNLLCVCVCDVNNFLLFVQYHKFSEFKFTMLPFSRLLSPQQHYDWGLRALKAILNSGGRIIQNLKSEGTDISKKMEFEILIKAVRVNTLSKLTFADTAKFLALINDVFPGADSGDMAGGDLEAAMREVCADWLLLSFNFLTTVSPCVGNEKQGDLSGGG